MEVSPSGKCWGVDIVKLFSQISTLKQRMYTIRMAVILAAFALWQYAGIAATKGVSTKRSGSALSGAMSKGLIIIIEIIFLVIAGYFAALLIPGVLTAFATTALTSVNGAVITLFQTILPFTFVTVIILLFLSVLVETFRML